MNLKQEILGLFERAKSELHDALDAVTADTPDYLAAIATVAEKHTTVQTLVQLLAKL